MMTRYLVPLFLGMILPLAAVAAPPITYAGIWATEGSVFKGEEFLGGVALYVDKDGTAILFNGGRPPEGCGSSACPPVGAMKAHIDLGDDSNAIVMSSRDMSGQTVSGTWFKYDPSTATLRGEVGPVKGKTLVRMMTSVSPRLMQTFGRELASLEMNIPAGFMTYKVPSLAMDPTLKLNHIVLTETFTKNLAQRGDIVAYESVFNKGAIYVHRIVGLPGDKVEIREATLFVNGVKVAEPYVPGASKVTPYSTALPQIEVPQDTVYVLGDNRDKSLDSRIQGPLAFKTLKGTVRMVKPSMLDADFAPVQQAQ